MTITPFEPPTPLPVVELDQRAQVWVNRLRAAAEYASYIADTEFVPDALRNRPAAIASAILFGDELGLTPMQSLAKLSYIKGKPSLTAEAQRSLILAAGHEMWFDESTITRAIAAGRRRGEDRIARITFTMDDAKRAGLAGQQNYRTYPAEMLRARASAALARTLFADVIGGLAAVEELEGETENGPAPVALPAEMQTPPADIATGVKPTRTRKRPAAAKEAVTPTPPPDTQPEPEVGAEPLITDAYRRRIFATMRDLGIVERDERLAYVVETVGHPIESSNELTISEASKVIDRLEADLKARTSGNPTSYEETPAPEQSTGDRLDQAVLDALEHNYTTIPDLWLQVATFKHKLPDVLIEELHGRDGTGRLLWQPLRDNLRPDEAADLLATLAARRAEVMPDGIPY